MTVIYVAEEHHRLYWHWKETGARDLRLCHVDFHCDMRGLLIDRAGQRATLYDERERGRVDQGNFLAHSVDEGIVRGIRWLHDPVGGRRYDHGTVRYESDLRVRLFPPRSARTGTNPGQADRWRPLSFREESLDGWRGPGPGEHLDLDWDALANTLYEPEHSWRLQEAFLAPDFEVRPEVVYFIYSYCSSVIDDASFEGFLERLRAKLDARVVRLSPLPPEQSTVSREKTAYQRLRARVIAPLKVPQLKLSSALKSVDTAGDLRFPYP